MVYPQSPWHRAWFLWKRHRKRYCGQVRHKSRVSTSPLNDQAPCYSGATPTAPFRPKRRHRARVSCAQSDPKAIVCGKRALCRPGESINSAAGTAAINSCATPTSTRLNGTACSIRRGQVLTSQFVGFWNPSFSSSSRTHCYVSAPGGGCCSCHCVILSFRHRAAVVETEKGICGRSGLFDGIIAGGPHVQQRAKCHSRRLVRSVQSFRPPRMTGCMVERKHVVITDKAHSSCSAGAVCDPLRLYTARLDWRINISDRGLSPFCCCLSLA